MLQPFEIFKISYVTRLGELKKNFLVTQSYPRGILAFSEMQKISLLVSDYDDLGLAKVHWNAVKNDKYAAIIKLEKPEHRKKMLEIIQPESIYNVYWALVKSKTELEQKVNRNYKDQIRRYITIHTSWRITSNSTVKTSLQVTFGELFIILKHGSQTLRIKFEEIEKV